jgi:hypothetical protein
MNHWTACAGSSAVNIGNATRASKVHFKMQSIVDFGDDAIASKDIRTPNAQGRIRALSRFQFLTALRDKH